MTTEASTPAPRVLIADDDPTIVLLLEHVLEGLGRSYDSADDGTAAWELWQKWKHPLVVLDIDMPGMDGLELCRRIRAAEPERRTFVLVVTGLDRAADLEAALNAGADDYVTKPTSGQRLTARLRIAQRRMDEEGARRSAEEELRKSRWLADIGEATVGLQHEINNPLTALLGTAELMLVEAKESGQGTAEIEMVIQQARRIVELVRKLDDLAGARSVNYAGRSDSKMLDFRTSS